LCCKDRPDNAQALTVLRLYARRAEITMLGNRIWSVLLITADEQQYDDNIVEDKHRYWS
jgi:hypothetical protein